MSASIDFTSAQRAENAPRNAPDATPRLWAIGGGKGGVGKSVVTASLGVALAALRRRTTLVDADLGAANLHTLLGIERSRLGLSDFLGCGVERLQDAACPTHIPRLSLVSGARALTDAANLPHSRKLKLTRHLARLDADEVLVDLGAGTALNVLDFFVAADRGIVIVSPEPTSIENTYAFLKAAFFRSLRPLTRDASVVEPLKEVLMRAGGDQLRAPAEIIAAVTDLDAGAGRRLAERANAFRPGMIVNGVRGDAERTLGRQIVATCHRFLGIRVELLGSLAWDPAVHRAVRARQPVPSVSENSEFWRELSSIAAHLASTRASVLPTPADPLPAFVPDSTGPGAYLRSWRQRIGLSLEQAIAQSRVRLAEAIENEAFEALPTEEVYLRGLVLNYARALGAPRPEALAIKFLERYRCTQHRSAPHAQRVAG